MHWNRKRAMLALALTLVVTATSCGDADSNHHSGPDDPPVVVTPPPPDPPPVEEPPPVTDQLWLTFEFGFALDEDDPLPEDAFVGYMDETYDDHEIADPHVLPLDPRGAYRANFRWDVLGFNRRGFFFAQPSTHFGDKIFENVANQENGVRINGEPAIWIVKGLPFSDGHDPEPHEHAYRAPGRDQDVNRQVVWDGFDEHGQIIPPPRWIPCYDEHDNLSQCEVVCAAGWGDACGDFPVK